VSITEDIMTMRRITLVAGSIGAIVASGLALAMWIANGIVYGSLVGLKGREHQLAIAQQRAVIALGALILLQGVAMFMTAAWLPRGQLRGAVSLVARLLSALVISAAGAGLVLVVVLQISRWAH
jgi:hypothetical protein